MVARYRLPLPAYLPIGPFDSKTGQRVSVRIDPQDPNTRPENDPVPEAQWAGEISFDGPPSTTWAPLNGEAEEKIREIVARKIEALKAAADPRISPAEALARKLEASVVRMAAPAPEAPAPAPGPVQQSLPKTGAMSTGRAQGK